MVKCDLFSQSVSQSIDRSIHQCTNLITASRTARKVVSNADIGLSPGFLGSHGWNMVFEKSTAKITLSRPFILSLAGSKKSSSSCGAAQSNSKLPLCVPPSPSSTSIVSSDMTIFLFGKWIIPNVSWWENQFKREEKRGTNSAQMNKMKRVIFVDKKEIPTT